MWEENVALKKCGALQGASAAVGEIKIGACAAAAAAEGGGPVSGLHALHRVNPRRSQCLRPYHVENTSSRLITEVKQRRARLVLGWVTAWEYRVP